LFGNYSLYSPNSLPSSHLLRALPHFTVVWENWSYFKALLIFPSATHASQDLKGCNVLTLTCLTFEIVPTS
jgi:hypothetical protein